MNKPIIAVLVTIDSKGAEARFVCDALTRAGAIPWLVDLSLRPHSVAGADVSGGDLAGASGMNWDDVATYDRSAASEVMIEGGKSVVRRRFDGGQLNGAIGVGGANGTSMACALMRVLPPLVPKVMVSTVAATAAVQWYVAESDVCMFPSIGDLSLNRITRSVMENAANAVAAMAIGRASTEIANDAQQLIGVSSFGGTAACVDRVSERLVSAGYEVIHFHASGPGGRALESLAEAGELAGVIDVTTHELTDLIVDGVYSAGDGRLKSAGAAGLPQIVIPGALDHANFWVGEVPERYAAREFFKYNAQNILMRTNAVEFRALGKLVADRVSAARGPVVVMIPTRGYSEHTKRMTQDLDGSEIGPWNQPEVDSAFVGSLRTHLDDAKLVEFDAHINDVEFADACVDKFLVMIAG